MNGSALWYRNIRHQFKLIYTLYLTVPTDMIKGKKGSKTSILPNNKNIRIPNVFAIAVPVIKYSHIHQAILALTRQNPSALYVNPSQAIGVIPIHKNHIIISSPNFKLDKYTIKGKTRTSIKNSSHHICLNFNFIVFIIAFLSVFLSQSPRHDTSYNPLLIYPLQ